MDESLREAIESDELELREPAPTPEWKSLDGKVYLQPPSAIDRIDLSDIIPDEDKEDERDVARELAFLVARGAVDENGARFFTDEDVEWLKSRNGDVVTRLATRLQNLGGITKASLEDAGKNSPGTQTEPSPSSSPEPSPTP